MPLYLPALAPLSTRPGGLAPGVDFGSVADLERVAVSAGDVGLEVVVGGAQGGRFRLTDSGRPTDGGVVWVPGSETTPAQSRPVDEDGNTFGGPISWASVADDAWGGGAVLDWHGLGRFGAQPRDTAPLVNTGTGRVRYPGTFATVTAKRITSDLRWERVVEPVTTALGTHTVYVDPAWWGATAFPQGYVPVPAAPAVPGAQDDGAIWWTDPVYNASERLAWAIQTAHRIAQETGAAVPVVLSAMYGHSIRIGLYDETPVTGSRVLAADERPTVGLRVLKGAAWHGVAISDADDPAYAEERTRRDRFNQKAHFGLYAEERVERVVMRDVLSDGGWDKAAYVWSPEYRAVNPNPSWNTDAHDLYRNGAAPGNGFIDSPLRVEARDDTGELVLDLERVWLVGSLNNSLNANTAASVTGRHVVIGGAYNNHHQYGLSTKPGLPPLRDVLLSGPALGQMVVAYWHEGAAYRVEWPHPDAPKVYNTLAPVTHRYNAPAWRAVRDWREDYGNQIHAHGRHYVQHGLAVDYSGAGPDPGAEWWVGHHEGGLSILTGHAVTGYPASGPRLFGWVDNNRGQLADERDLCALLGGQGDGLPRVGALVPAGCRDIWVRDYPVAGDGEVYLLHPRAHPERQRVVIDGSPVAAYDPSDKPYAFSIADKGGNDASGLDVFVRGSDMDCARLVHSSGVVPAALRDSCNFYFRDLTLGATPSSSWEGRCSFHNVTFADGETAVQKGLQPVPQIVLNDWPEEALALDLIVPHAAVPVGRSGLVWATAIAGKFPQTVVLEHNGQAVAETTEPNVDRALTPGTADAIRVMEYALTAASGTNTVTVTATDANGVVRTRTETFEAA